MAENEKVETAAAAKKTAKPDKAKKKKPSVFSRFAAWLRSVKAELKKIVWTSPKAVRANSIIVIVVIIIFAVATGFVDLVFKEFFRILGILI